MAILYGEQGRAPLMDADMTAVMRRWVNAVIGIGFAALAVAIALALWSFNVGDPSLYTGTSQAPMNWLGEPGSWAADLLMRYTGLGAWALVVFLLVWALRFVVGIGEQRIWARLLLAMPALAFAPVFASLHEVYQGWPLATGLGGALGDTGARMLLDLVPLADLQAIRVLALALAFAMALVGGAALGLTLEETSNILSWLGRSLTHVLRAVGTALYSAGRRGVLAGLAKLREARAKPRSESMDPATPTGGWRARMPKVPKVAMPDLSGVSLAGVRKEEPEFRFDRIDGSGATEPEVNAAEHDEPPIVRVHARRDLDTEESAGMAGEGGLMGGSLRAVFDRLSDQGEMAAPLAGPDPVPEPSVRPPATASDLPRPPVERDTRKPRRSRQAEAERQPSLALDEKSFEEFVLPELALLQKPVAITRTQMSDLALEENARMLETVLEDYGVRGEIVAVRPGPVVTLYELEPAPGLKASRVIGLADDIARSMSALAARVSTVPGRSIIGIELPNADREKVWLRDTFESREYGDARFPLALALGKDISGAPVIANLAKMPHLLIAGTTGSGKSVAINTMILSLLYRLTPEQCRLIMIDPKMLELSVYDNIPHLLSPVVTDPKKAIVALKWVVAEMEERYRKMSRMGVRNIDGYNARVRDALAKGEDFSRTVQTGFDDATGEPIYETEAFEPQELPFIVVIVDEMADLMMVAGKEIEACIQRLAQMARASGIHLIMATQRPSVDVITGTIKANFPTRISFQVTSKIDSRTILGEQGAEQLLGMGDMLYMEGGGRIRRVHGPFVSDEEVEEIVQHLKAQGVPDYVGAVTEGVDDEAQALVDEKLGLGGGNSEDELYDRAVAIVARDRKCSTSYIQRKLAIGYNKAARLVEQMEEQGVVTSANAVGKREILIEER
ncbi:MAG: DNA translocase FtsK [Pseudomonadota bacterium]